MKLLKRLFWKIFRQEWEVGYNRGYKEGYDWGINSKQIYSENSMSAPYFLYHWTA